MFNSGIRGKRASDNTGTVASQSQFIQQQYPQPSITGYSIAGTDDTALDPAGGQTVLVNGTGFASGAAVTVNGITISPVTVVSPTQLSFTSTALAGGSYTLIVYNSTGGAAILVPGLIYSAVPTWTTAAGSIGTYYETIAINSNVVATSDSAITYSLSSGSLPSGATLYGNGVITGTSPVESGSTTYTFAIKAEDAELQDTTRTFTLTINTDVVTWSAPADGTTYTANINEVASNVVLSATSAAGYGITYSANTLPTGLSLAGNTISGTPTVVGNSATLLTATASTTNRNATRTINWVIQLGSDPYFYATSLLLNGESNSTYWIQDASTNGFTVTVNGDTKPVAFSPYETVWSSFFDGSGDYLTVADNAALESFTDFTIEFWVYFNSVSGTQVILDKGWNNASIAPYLIFSSNDSLVVYASSNGSGWDVISGSSFGTFVTARWYHIALTRSGSSIRLFRDGSLITTVTNSSTIWNNSSALGIGGSPSAGANPLNGYISNLRIVKGTAVYTSAFIPPTAPLTAIANTSLLTCQSNRLIDNSTNNFTLTRNGDVLVSNFGPFVETDITTGSGYFDGNGDYLSISSPSSSIINWYSTDFTCEGWIFPTTLAGLSYADGAGTHPTFIGNRTTNTGSDYWGFGPCTDGQVRLYYYNGGSGNTVSSGLNIIINQWNHIAFTKTSSGVKFFVNGTSSGFTALNGTPQSGSGFPFLIGVANNTYLTGYVSNVRLVNGTAVYTSAFTPPTSPLIAIANTSLLTLQSRIGETNNRFVDTSGINNIITRFNNTTQGTFSPFSQTGWSGYFTGSSTSYISTPSTTILNQGQTYTVQCWIYPTSFTTSTSAVRRMYIFVKGVIYAGLSIHSDGTLGWYGWPTPGGIIVASPAGTITTNVWQHVALVVYPSNYIKLFKNGTEVGTAGYTAAGADGSAIIIGHGDTGQSTDGFIGYISNFKITLSALTGGQLDYSATPTISSSTGTSLLVLQTNRFNDTSVNNLTITAAAAASIQSFSPFAPAINTPTSYSAYFDGNGDTVSFPNSTNFAFGTGAFTIEFWIYAPTASNSFLLGGRNAIGGMHITLGGFGGTTSGSLRYVASSTITSGATLIADNNWHHCAIVRDGSTNITLYVDGISRGTGTDTNNYTATTNNFVIGQNDLGASEYLTGYLSNYRIVKGTAVYTGNFTPSTTPLTAISNTSLLILQSTTFIDNSGNRVELTVNGDTAVRSFNPFGTTSLTGSNAAYSIANVGGSMYFDGTGDYLSMPHSAALVYGTNNFTIEFWIYVNAYGSPSRIFQKGTGGTGYSMDMSNTGTLSYNNNSGIGGSTTTVPVPLKAWTHVALVRSGTSTNQTRWYINGQSAGTWTYSVNVSEAESLVIGGSSASLSVNGYITNFRLVNGSAIYSAPFAPLVAPLTPIAGTTLLVNGTNSGIIDYTGKNDLETAGSSKLSTTIKKFGSASMYFDGTGDFVQQFASNQTLSFRTGDFTVECWIYFNTSGQHGICQISSNPGGFNTSAANSIAIQRSATGQWEIYAKNTNPQGNATINQSQWYHVALVRSGTTTTFYVDGTALITVSADTTDYTGTYIGLGAIYSTAVPLNGYIDDFRVTTGVARYTTNFTPPTQAFITF